MCVTLCFASVIMVCIYMCLCLSGWGAEWTKWQVFKIKIQTQYEMKWQLVFAAISESTEFVAVFARCINPVG